MEQNFGEKKAKASCVVCGKPVPVRDIRDLRSGKPFYCGRVHAQIAKYATRHRGSNSGPMDRPSTDELLERTHKL